MGFLFTFTNKRDELMFFLKIFNCYRDDYQYFQSLLFPKKTYQFYQKVVQSLRGHLVARGRKDRYDPNCLPDQK